MPSLIIIHLAICRQRLWHLSLGLALLRRLLILNWQRLTAKLLLQNGLITCLLRSLSLSRTREGRNPQLSRRRRNPSPCSERFPECRTSSSRRQSTLHPRCIVCLREFHWTSQWRRGSWSRLRSGRLQRRSSNSCPCRRGWTWLYGLRWSPQGRQMSRRN